MDNPSPKRRPARSAGILLHPTSLPGPFGIGDLGPVAYAWVDTLARARQTWWQVLPLGPTGFGDSPYQCFSAFAGNPYLVSPELLLRDGLLDPGDLAHHGFRYAPVDYGPVIQFKVYLLGKAWANFRAGRAPSLRAAFDAFCAEEHSWLHDFALFMALKDAHGGRCWLEWGPSLVRREPAALKQAEQELADSVGQHKFRQFVFFRQWEALRQYAREKGIRLIGDVPIFVAADSADVWANPDLFLLDAERRPRFVAGVPPDYFSQTGQLWGNPLYDWDRLQETGFAWWVERLRLVLRLVDLVRLDHFRGFEAYWRIPAGMPTAEVGEWVKAPGEALLTRLRQALDGLPLIAEDLGVITPEVEALRDRFGLPGMRILQFAFTGDPEDRFLPHNYEANTVVYTGTHDNDTTRGWFATLPEKEASFLRRYLPLSGDIAADLVRLAWSSVADYAVAPLQDVLSLGTEARMNFPGRPDGNWGWRFFPEMLSEAALGRLAEWTEIYGRAPSARP
ncbi:MAG: 4-alpha-glucanotransferase [Gemmataceae bacterium]|nr:4-alpha-glucanotransferase [Gemmataceae bacterium]MDW8265535.1 4-alpha-glucanotransferase [Gemmataceae bacterium]